MPNEEKFNSLEDLLVQAAGGTPPTPPTPPTPAGATPPADEVPPTSTPAGDSETPQPNTPAGETPPTGETPPAPAVETPPANEDEEGKGKGKPNPMKEVREKYNQEKSTREKISNAIERFTEGTYTFVLKDFKVDGKVDYDSFIKAMDEADLKVKAEAKGIAPEVQAEIERIEKEKVELNKQRLQVAMDRALTNMQQELGLKSADVNNFFKDAMAVKKNPYQWLAQGGDLHDLYRNIYWDKLIKEKTDAAVAAAKTTWEADLARGKQAPVKNPAQANPPSPANPSNGISMEQLLIEAANKHK